MLLGYVALRDGPSRGVGLVRKCITPQFVPTRVEVERSREFMAAVPKHATSAYTGNCASDVERLGATLAGQSLRDLMVESSYHKSYAEVETRASMGTLSVGRITEHYLTRGTSLVDALRATREQEPGVLSKYPLIMLLKPMLKSEHLAQMIASLGLSVDDDVYTQAWGVSGVGCHTVGVVSYSDAGLAAGALRDSNCVIAVRLYQI
jgi:hypothetical protein